MSTKEQSEGDSPAYEPEEPQASTSSGTHPPRTEQPEDLFLSGRTSSNIISILDMVWTGLEVVLVLMCILPNDRTSWEIAVTCLIPNVIQFSGAFLMYKRTEKIQDSLILFRSCQLWFVLAFLTVSLQAAFLTWTTVTGVITKFLVFILLLKFFWRFTVMFFINEFHNQLELICLSHNNYTLLLDVAEQTTANRITTQEPPSSLACDSRQTLLSLNSSSS